MISLFDHLEIEDEIKRYLTIKEVAQTLSVSEATIRNWMKAGKIIPNKVVNRKNLFLKSDILQIKKEIETGEFQRLKSRRNKKAITGAVIPTEYVTFKPYISIAETICDLTNEINHPDKIRLILLEVAMKLLEERSLIEVTTPCEYSFIELIQSKTLHLNNYEQIFNELLPIHNVDISDSDKNKLRQIRSLDIPFVSGEDVLGLIYMSLSSIGDRKNSGSYYTPSAIVENVVLEIFQQINKDWNKSFIDPCCGSGNFLLKTFLHLRTKFLTTGKTVEEVESHIIQQQIFGYDIDSIAVTLCKLNIVIHLQSDFQPTLIPQIRVQNTLKVIHTNEQYDVIIGNPPWGYSFHQDDIQFFKQHYEIAQSSLESFNLFLERSLNMLSDDGYLSFVLPESLLNVKTHEQMRQLLLENTSIQRICVLGHQFSKVFAPAIVLTVKKEKAPNNHEIEIIHADEQFVIDQQRFMTNDQYIFNVFASNEVARIIDHLLHIENHALLKDHADFALGIVTGNNREFIKSEKVENSEMILKGNQIYKYNFVPSEQYIVFEPEKFQQVAPVELYRAKEKLIYRFINAHLVFAYDNKQTLTLNSANIVIPNIEGLKMKYILAVLNSRVAQFFHKYTFSSVKVLRKHIESIPIPVCSSEEQQRIIELVDALINCRDTNKREQLYEKIDENIMTLYNLNEEQQKLIKDKIDIKFLHWDS